MDAREEAFDNPRLRDARVSDLAADGYTEAIADGRPLKPGQYRKTERFGRWILRIQPSCQSKADAVRKIWAGRSVEEKRMIGEKISRARKGQKRNPESVRQSGESLRRQCLKASKEEKRARTAVAVEAARRPEVKERRQASLEKWRRANPGSPGSRGLTVGETVALFFVSNPNASDAECAKAIGRSIDMVRKHRDRASRLPWRRDLLRRVVNLNTISEIIDRVNAAFPTMERAKLAAFLEQIAAGKTMREAKVRSGISATRGEAVADWVLIEIGEHSRSDWRPSNRNRRKALTPGGLGG